MEKIPEAYKAFDGTLFDSELDCLNHEKKIEEDAACTTYWKITTNPDLTEGKGWYSYTLLKVKVIHPHTDAKLLVQGWCHDTYGNPVSYVMGCSPMEKYLINEIKRDEYYNPKTSMRSMSAFSKRVELFYYNNTAGLVTEQ